MLSASVMEIDCNDEAVSPQTVTLGAPVVDPSGLVTVLVGGGEVDSNVMLRCAFTLANGVEDEGTLLLPIRNL